MNTDIIARWRDAITDPPPEGWDGLARHKYSHGYGHGFHVWYASGEYTDEDGDVIMDVDSEWLDVTDIPAVPLSKVQAAVDLVYSRYNSLTADAKTINGWHMGIEESLAVLNSETGVTPSIVPEESSAPREVEK
jgi:hypothetical protein